MILGNESDLYASLTNAILDMLEAKQQIGVSLLLSTKLARQRTKYMKRRVKYYPNSVVQFNILLLAGDVETNPGDVKNPCSVCARSVAKNHRAISCDSTVVSHTMWGCFACRV